MAFLTLIAFKIQAIVRFATTNSIVKNKLTFTARTSVSIYTTALTAFHTRVTIITIIIRISIIGAIAGSSDRIFYSISFAFGRFRF